MNISELTRFNNYNSFIGIKSSLYNNLNNNISSVNNKTNNYNNTLNNFSISSSYNNTYTKKLNELQEYTNDSKEFYSDFVDNFSDLKRSSNSLKSYGSSSVFKEGNYGSKVQNAMNNSKNLYPSFKFSSGDSSIYSSNNANIIYSQYNSIYSSGLFLNSLR